LQQGSAEQAGSSQQLVQQFPPLLDRRLESRPRRRPRRCCSAQQAGSAAAQAGSAAQQAGSADAHAGAAAQQAGSAAAQAGSEAQAGAQSQLDRPRRRPAAEAESANTRPTTRAKKIDRIAAKRFMRIS